ncbi:HypC/HybG/HupF family hydrogenase formation chaperone [soil metagenome]|jgi:hydrogenase expression/formation protein HypC|nr:HypC/HybG/HupF family hydrogenase formation chaperone [Deinococcota bacterium]
MCLAIPGRVTDFLEDKHFAIIEVSGVRRKVNVDLLAEEGLEQDDWVLIHVGFAMSKIGAKEAEEQMALLTMLGEADEALAEVQGYGVVEEPGHEP